MAGTGFDKAAHAAKMRADGWWEDLTADDLLAHAINANPDKPAIISYRHDAGDDAPVTSMTYAELGDAVSKAEGVFRAMVNGAGDVVAVMLPNWRQFVVASHALTRLGAVPSPLMHIFRECELRFMLKFADTKAIVIPKTFRGHDFEGILAGPRGELPNLTHVVVVDGDGPNFWDAMVTHSTTAPLDATDVDPIEPAMMSVLMHTSGTTGEPKCVMHCQNTLVACTKALENRFGLIADDLQIGSRPFGHMTGYAAVMFQSFYYGASMVMMDVWEPKTVVPLMAREGIAHMAAATPFLADICKEVEAVAPVPPLKTFLCGGAQIPPVIVGKARKLLGIKISSLWGMSEALSGSLTEPARASEKSATTDGRALEGVDLLIADEDLNPLPQGETGRL